MQKALSSGFIGALASIGATKPKIVAESLRVLWSALFFLIYVGLDAVSYIEPITPFAITPWNPALGFCVAITALWGPRALLLVLVAPLLADTLNRGFPLTPLYSVWVGMLTVAETSLVVFGARRLMRIAANTIFDAEEIEIFVASVPGALLVAVAHVSSLIALGLLPQSQFLESIGRLWVGDIIGILVVTPFCFLLFRSAQRKSFQFERLSETGLQAVAVLVTLWLIFVLQLEHTSEYFYLLFVPMIWIVLRHGAKGAVVMNVFVQGAIVMALLWLDETDDDIVKFQAMLSVFVVSGLTLGWAVDQRRDATRNLRAREEELAASLKTATTSELAGTLAHELSHPLGAISNYAAALHHLLVKATPLNADILPILNKLNQEVKRATDTVHHLRDFFRTGSLVMQTIDLGELTRESAALLINRMAGNTITPQLSIQPGANIVLADPIQMHAVIHNLLVNAVDALQPVSTERRTLLVSVNRTHASVILRVDDSGAGIAQDIRGNIFDGLTTTKKDGLGLGLSICRSIVLAHGGRIELEESKLGGASFVVTLPVNRQGDV